MINHRDWKIHKILQEEKARQRLHKRLLLRGRGNGKTSLITEELEDFITASNKPAPTKLCKADIELIKEAVIDYDVYNYLVSPHKDYVDKCIEDLMKDYYHERRKEWKPIVRMDTTVVDGYDYFKWFLQSKCINPYLKSVYKIDDSNLD